MKKHASSLFIKIVMMFVMVKNGDSDLNMGVLLSRKSEARSIITGNSVSSSNSCLEMMMVMVMVMMVMMVMMVTLMMVVMVMLMMKMLMMMMMMMMAVMLMLMMKMMVLLMMVEMLPLTCRQWPSGRRFHMQLAKAS